MDRRLRNRPLTGASSLSRSERGAETVSEEEGERRACARRALHPYLAAVGLGDLAGYGQSQARAAIGAGRGQPCGSTRRRGGKLILRDADACIRDRQRHAVFLHHTDRDVPAPGVYLIALSRRMEATRITRSRSKVAVTSCSMERTRRIPCRQRLPCAPSRLLPNRTEVVTSYLHGCALITAGWGE